MTDQRLRKFWADKSILGALNVIQIRAWISDFERPGTVAVVEHSAYEALEAKLKIARDALLPIYRLTMTSTTLIDVNVSKLANKALEAIE